MLRIRAPYVPVFVGASYSNLAIARSPSSASRIAPSRAAPGSERIATRLPSGPPVWYDEAHRKIGAAMVDVTGADYDAYWMDRLAEFLHSWQVDVEKRADAVRSKPPIH